MCIVLLTTAHPDYAVIIIDNRDEFILRPTSRPHWWTHPNGASVLSSRDLQRAEKGTWLGITKTGSFAVLTNYRETNTHDAQHPVHGTRSRGGMVTAWLGSDPKATTADSVHTMVREGGVKGVGGFSMVCGKLQKTKGSAQQIQPIAIISNRNDHVDQVPWVGGDRGEVYGLSNTAYDNPVPWPKIENGKRLVKEAIDHAIASGLSNDALAEKLFEVLDKDTLPQHPDMSMMDYIAELKHSIFIPSIGDEEHRKAMAAATAKGKAEWANGDQAAAEEELVIEARPDAQNLGFETGMYGTQRQTVITVDWEGNVVFRERALWDGNGNPLERGQSDEVFRFKIDGWDS
jgi:uncharacterized protein with NRDE domain